MYKRIKDLEQTNKLLSDIIMELVKKIPKGDLPKNIVWDETKDDCGRLSK